VHRQETIDTTVPLPDGDPGNKVAGAKAQRLDVIHCFTIFNSLTSLIHADYYRYHQPSGSSRKSSPFFNKPLKILII